VVKIGFFGQFLLAPFFIPAIRSDVFAQDFAVFRDFHNPIWEPKTVYMDYRICTVFCSCIFPALCRFWCRMNTQLIFLRRLGPDPHENGAKSVGCSGCPDIFELADGDFAVIGADITEAARMLPPTAGCGPDERIVRIPRKTLVLAKSDIPNQI
jgi:hypothetical protein